MSAGNLRRVRRALVMTLLAALPAIAWAADRPARFAVANSQLDALGIRTAPLSDQAAPVGAEFPAQVVLPPNAEQVISSPVNGLVAQVLVNENQVVGAHAPLIRIASAELGQLQLQLLQAGARATLARQAAQREQKLFDEGIIPQRRVHEAQASLKEAEAALNQAKAALRLSGLSPAAIDKVGASGTPQDGITLTASRGGVITGIAVKTGQRVEPATALLHVTQTDTLWLDVHIPVAESANWPVGTRLKLKGRDITARVVSTSTMVAPGTQTVALRAVVERAATPLRPGEAVTVEASALARAGAWDVPLSAVAYDGNRAYLFVRTPDGFEAKGVKVTASSGQRVRIEAPLEAGQQIAVSGIAALKGAWLEGKQAK